MRNVLLAVGDASEAFDTLYPLHRLREEDYRVLVAAPERRTYHLVLHDRRPDWDVTVELPGYKLAADVAFRDVTAEECVGLVLPGGRAPEYLRYDADLIRITQHFAETGKPIASICHGIEVLATADVVRGRRCATIPKCRFDLEVAGGTFVDEEVVVDGNIVTARGKRDCHAWLREYVKRLNAFVETHAATEASAGRDIG